MMNYSKAGTPDYYANLDLQYQRGEIPLSIYQQLNDKPAWYNIELSKEELMKSYNERRQREADAKAYKDDYIKEAQKQAKKEFEKEIPKLFSDVFKDIAAKI